MARKGRFLQRLTIAVVFVGLSLTAIPIARAAMLSDATILAELRPATSSDVEMILLRDGSAQYIDTSSLPDRPQVAEVEPPAPEPAPPKPAPRPPHPMKTALRKPIAIATKKPAMKVVAVHPIPIPTHSMHPQSVRIAALPPKPKPVATPQTVAKLPAPAATPRPAVKPPVPVLKPKAVAAKPKTVAVIARVPRPPPFILADTRKFVPPADVPKPSNSPTPLPAPVHDANWAYEHRFDAPTEDVPIPGVPVRSQSNSPFGKSSGAFHGVRSRNGYSAIRVVVSIPCGDAHFQAQGADVETGYIYIGGWGSGPNGVAVDAGLQKSSAQNATDDYAFYWKYASNKPFTVSNQNRFPCGGPDVTLELYAVSNDLMVFSANGVTADGVRRNLIAIQRTKSGDGWIPGGGTADDGIILKRIVSIAQPPEWTSSPVWSTRRWSSGSYFGIGGPGDPTPKIVWKKCQIGHVVPPRIKPDYRDWTDKETWHAPPGVYTDWPPADVRLASHGYCDVVGLYLSHG